MTSPPGGGTTAWPQRARSGPARRTRRADAFAELLVELVARRLRRVDHDLAVPPLDGRAEMLDELEHGLDIEDARDVRECHRLVGQEAGGDDRQGGVLVPGRPDMP